MRCFALANEFAGNERPEVALRRLDAQPAKAGFGQFVAREFIRKGVSSPLLRGGL